MLWCVRWNEQDIIWRRAVEVASVTHTHSEPAEPAEPSAHPRSPIPARGLAVRPPRAPNLPGRRVSRGMRRNICILKLLFRWFPGGNSAYKALQGLTGFQGSVVGAACGGLAWTVR